MTYDIYTYDPEARISWMRDLAYVLRQDPSGLRGWHGREQNEYAMHDAVWEAVRLAPPIDWHLLVLEWPHIATSDPQRLAYTRDDRAGHDNKQTITSIGKYLRRHFSPSKLRDDQIRDIVALCGASGCEVVHTMDEILDTLQRGPQSCMRWNDCHSERHPYRVYEPAYGWGMARRVAQGDVVGRALVYKDPDSDYKCYVRSYKKGDGYSYADEMLEAWLKQQGYVHRGGWPEGAHMAFIERGSSWGSFLAPYIDGDVQNVDIVRIAGEQRLRICDGGEYVCNNTDGTPEQDEDETEACESCGDYNHSEDMYWVGARDETHVCEHCYEYRYSRALSRGGIERNIHEDNVLYLESTDRHYDLDYLDENNIITLENGEHEHRDHAWECEHSNEWYSEDVDSITVKDSYGNELTIHPMYADEYPSNDEDNNEGEE